MATLRFSIGLDVHDAMIAYAVREYRDGLMVLSGECASRFDDLHKVLSPYLSSCVIGLESCTCYYHIYNSFKSKGYNILVANTLRIRQLISKNDRVDAERLSDMLRLGSFPTSYVPDIILSQLRTLVSLRQGFVEESTRFQNRISAILSKYGFKIYERTHFSKRWCEQLRLIMVKHPELKELSYGFENYLFIENKIDCISAELITFSKVHWAKEFELLKSIPGIGDILASYYIAEICPINRFSSDKKLRRYAGVIPCFQESGGHTYGSRLPKSSSRSLLRWALVQSSWAAVKGKNNLAKYFNKKKKTKPKSRAIMCIASSLCDIIFKVLSTNKPYAK